MEAEDGSRDSLSVLSSLANRADQLLYAAKHAGRNRVMGGEAAGSPPAASNHAA